MAATLEELWISYNQIASLDGISCCTNLTTLYISNNAIKSWSELDKLVRHSMVGKEYLVLVEIQNVSFDRLVLPTCEMCCLQEILFMMICLRSRLELKFSSVFLKSPKSTGTWSSQRKESLQPVLRRDRYKCMVSKVSYSELKFSSTMSTSCTFITKVVTPNKTSPVDLINGLLRLGFERKYHRPFLNL